MSAKKTKGGVKKGKPARRGRSPPTSMRPWHTLVRQPRIRNPRAGLMARQSTVPSSCAASTAASQEDCRRYRQKDCRHAGSNKNGQGSRSNVLTRFPCNTIRYKPSSPQSAMPQPREHPRIDGPPCSKTQDLRRKKGAPSGLPLVGRVRTCATERPVSIGAANVGGVRAEKKGTHDRAQGQKR